VKITYWWSEILHAVHEVRLYTVKILVLVIRNLPCCLWSFCTWT